MTVEKGYVDAPVPDGVDIVAEIRRLKKEKQAVVLAHYYQSGDIQDIADHVGDSLAMAQYAATLRDAKIIVVCGVHFMGETAKLLCPDKKVLIPDTNAGCSLADSCPPEAFEAFVKAHPGHTVVSYVNTSVGVKALTDIVVTSGNARKVIDSLPADEKIIFGPSGAAEAMCTSSSPPRRLQSSRRSTPKHACSCIPSASVRSHCLPTAWAPRQPCSSTRRRIPPPSSSSPPRAASFTRCAASDKTFIPAPPSDSTCGCNDCAFMKLITMEKLYNTLRYELPEIHIDPAIADRARRPIDRMLELS